MNNNIYLIILNGIVKKEFSTHEEAVVFTTKQAINYSIATVDKKIYNNYKKSFKSIFASDPQTRAYNKILFEKKPGDALKIATK